MSDEGRDWFRQRLPSAARAVWGTIILSTLAFFVFGTAAANIVAIIGAVIVTVVLVTNNRS